MNEKLVHLGSVSPIDDVVAGPGSGDPSAPTSESFALLALAETLDVVSNRQFVTVGASCKSVDCCRPSAVVVNAEDDDSRSADCPGERLRLAQVVRFDNPIDQVVFDRIGSGDGFLERLAIT